MTCQPAIFAYCRNECWQPDCIEDDEYNLIIMIDGLPYKTIGIFFDFTNEGDKQ